MVGFQKVPLYIALDKIFFQSRSIDIFLISLQKHMLWVLIRSALVPLDNTMAGIQSKCHVR